MKKTIDANTKMTEVVELSDKKYFKAAMIKILQWAIMNMLKTNGKVEILSREIEFQLINGRYKEEPNRNFTTEKYNNQKCNR